MSEAVQVAVERLLTNRAPTLTFLYLSWFGGEPLLARDIVLRLSHHAARLSEQHGFRLIGGLTTNGFLLNKELSSELISLHQDFFQISLDGWREGHDATRMLAGRAPTFDVIWENLIALKSLRSEFDALIRLHLHDDNFPSIEKLCIELVKEFGDDSRFRIDFQKVKNLGGPGGTSVKSQPNKVFYERVKRLSELLELGSSTFGTHVSSRFESRSESAGTRRRSEIMGDEQYICYASKPNSLIIRADGRLAKCTVRFDDPANDVGRIQENGSLKIDLQRVRRWFHGLTSLDPEALACPAEKLT
jgi:uncharacterized protein